MIDDVIQPDPAKLRRLATSTRVDHAYMSSSGLRRWYWSARRQGLSYYFAAPPQWRVLLRTLQKDRVRPDFASIGAVRSGTTFLSECLMQHPSVVLPLAKEIRLKFALERLLLAQMPTTSDMDVVRARTGKAMTGFCAPVVPSTRFSLLWRSFAPTSKVILVLREPIARAISHWRWDQRRRQHVQLDPLWSDYPDFAGLARLEMEFAKAGAAVDVTASGPRAGGYLQCSIYAPFVRNLFRFFGRESVKVVCAEDVFEKPRETINEIYEFLELPRYNVQIPEIGNANRDGRTTKALSDETMKELENFFRPLNRQLFDLIGRELPWPC